MLNILSLNLRSLRLVGLLILLGCAGLILTACGEKAQVFELGIYLDSPSSSLKINGLKDGLKALGYSEGVSIHYNLLNPAEFKAEQLPAKVSDFVARDYQAYWTGSNDGAIQLRQAGLKKPIIVAGLASPVQSGLIKSYYHPDSNINGVDSLDTELTLNRLNLILTFDPGIRKIYLLYDPTSPVESNYLPTLRDEASRLGITLVEKPITSRQASKDVLSQLKANEAKAILTIGGRVLDDKLDLDLLKSVIVQEKLMLVGAERSDLDQTALFSYGGNYSGLGRQSATYVDRVLHGVSPAQIPILQPNQLELVLNQKIADQIGWKFDPDELGTADEVIK